MEEESLKRTMKQTDFKLGRKNLQEKQNVMEIFINHGRIEKVNRE